MPRPTRAKPPVPAWIIRERKRLGLKPRELAERLTAMGLTVTEGTVRTWEAGRNPHPDNVEGLERIFGSAAPGSDQPTGDLATAVSALTEELRAWRQGREELEGRLQGLEESVKLLNELALEALPKRPVPDGTRE